MQGTARTLSADPCRNTTTATRRQHADDRSILNGYLGDMVVTTRNYARDGSIFDGYRGGEEERAGGMVELRRGIRDDAATKGGAKGPITREKSCWG